MRDPRSLLVFTIVSLDVPQARLLEATHIAEIGRRYGGAGMRPADAGAAGTMDPFIHGGWRTVAVGATGITTAYRALPELGKLLGKFGMPG